MATSSAAQAEERPYPPLPESGPDEDSTFAEQNFAARERASRSWLNRILPASKLRITPLQRRHIKLVTTTDEDEIAQTQEFSGRDDSAVQLTSEPTEPADISTARLPVALDRSQSSQDTGRITLEGKCGEDPQKNEHLYRWAMVYENQRGYSLFSSTRYSSRSLLPNDPPPFTVVAPDLSLIDGKPVTASRADQPDVSLAEFPLPDGNWRWASKEWMVDMRNENVSYDGFEYNWFFRRHHWRRRPGKLNAAGWVRRRRWVRLMERPPLAVLEEEEESKKLAISPPVVIEEVWRSDRDHWSRISQVMRECGRDARMLEVWKGWLGVEDGKQPSDEEKQIYDDKNRPDSDLVSIIVKNHADDLLRFFVYPRSRVQLLSLCVKAGVLSRDELTTSSKSSPFYYDRKEAAKVRSEDL